MHSYAISPPKPITGYPGINSQTMYLHAGEYIFTLDIPIGWGMGEFSTHNDGTGSFKLFPNKGGFGCQITIERSDESIKSMKTIQKKFSKVKEITNGFETELSNAFFCCLATEQHLIQIWYSLSKKRSEHSKNWKSLRNCLTISKESPQTKKGEVISKEYPRAIETLYQGWSFFHPEGKRRVFFKTLPDIPFVTLNEEEFHSYLIKFTGFKFSGYFYIKWDQSVALEQPSSENQNPYQEFIKEMIYEIDTLEPNQRCGDKQLLSTEIGCILVRGNAYSFFAWAGKGFLMGLVVENEQIEKTDIAELLLNFTYDIWD